MRSRVGQTSVQVQKRTGRAASDDAKPMSIGIGLIEYDEHRERRHVEAEERFPHGEPLATDDHEAEEPDEECKRGACNRIA